MATLSLQHSQRRYEDRIIIKRCLATKAAAIGIRFLKVNNWDNNARHSTTEQRTSAHIIFYNHSYSPALYLLVSSTWVTHDTLASSTFHQGWLSASLVIEQEVSSTAFPSTALLAWYEPNWLLWLAGRPKAKLTSSATAEITLYLSIAPYPTQCNNLLSCCTVNSVVFGNIHNTLWIYWQLQVGVACYLILHVTKLWLNLPLHR